MLIYSLLNLLNDFDCVGLTCLLALLQIGNEVNLHSSSVPHHHARILCHFLSWLRGK